MSTLDQEADRTMSFFRFTVDRAPEAIFWVDSEAQCHHANLIACQWLGYSREELQAMKVHEFCPDHQADGWPEYWKILREGKLITFETHLRTKDGRMIPVEASCNYIEMEGKDYTCAFARDISERKQIQAAIEALRKHNDLILNASGEGIFGLDLQGRHTFVNPAAAHFLGYRVEELLGKPSHNTWHHTKPDGQPYPPEECPIYRAYKDGLVHHGEDEVFWRKDGTSFPARYTSTPIHDESGKLVGAVVTFEDITERRRLAAQLLEEAKLAEVTRVLGDIGHDIKNMLMPVLSGTSLLQEELDEHFHRLASQDLTKVQASQNLSKEITDMIANNARRIQDRVREISDAVKGVTAPITFAPCELSKITRDVIDTLRLYASEKNVTLKTEGLQELPSIQGDERRLFNAFYNLMNNAIPEVAAGGSVTVRGTLDPDGKTVLVSVEDTGRGMPAEIRDSLFTPRAISRKTGGTGLGTKIIKDVVDAHRGTITVESQEGIGTTFHLTLPITQAR